MKAFGYILVIVGIALGIYAITADTTVGNVYNIGLLSQQRNLIIIAGILFVGGVIGIGFGYFLESKATVNDDTTPKKENGIIWTPELMAKLAIYYNWGDVQMTPIGLQYNLNANVEFGWNRVTANQIADFLNSINKG